MNTSTIENFVETPNISFYTRTYFKNVIEKDFSTERFENNYKNNPNRMTQAQIRMNGGFDSLRSSLWSRFNDAKYYSLNNALLAVSTQVCEQILKVIKAKYPKFPIKMNEGEVKKYGDRKLILTELSAYTDDYYFYITPTLDDEDNLYFKVNFCNDSPKVKFETKCDDKELLEIIDEVISFLSTKEVPSTFFKNKIYHWVENQYTISFNNRKFENMYDFNIVLMYHCLAKELNKIFGTNFEYSQEIIDKLYKFKNPTNINYLGSFYLKTYDYRKNEVELHENYFYEDDKTKKPTFGCTATYGYYSKEDIIALVETIKPYVLGDYLYKMSKKYLGGKYDQYDKIGIGYSERPNYYDEVLAH